MSNTFTFIGKLNLGKETEKFKPIKTSKSAKGWLGTRLNFSLFNNTGYHNLEMFEGYMENGATIIYCLGKDKGSDGKLPRMQVAWKDRFNQEIIEQVAGFNKYVIELGDVKKEFLAGSDFLQELIAVLKNEAYKDTKFQIDGSVEYTRWNGKVYRKFVPRTVKTVSNEVADESTVRLDFYYTQGAINELTEGKFIVSGFTRQYNSTLKAEEPFVEEVIIDTTKATNEKQLKAFQLIKNRFMVNDESFMKLGVKTVMLNGREKIDITMEDLTDEEKELIEYGLATFEEIAREYGGTMNGDKVTEMKVVGFNYGYNKGAQLTTLTADDFEVVDATEELVGATETVDDFEDEDLPF